MSTLDAVRVTWLYVPGDRPDVVAKALGSGADVVLVDLEDAVAPDRKAYALDATAELLADRHGVPVHVRVNALDGPLAEHEVRRLAPLPGLDALRLPKVHDPADLARVADWAVEVPPLYALLESALGVEQAYAIASHPSVHGIALGEADLRADLGIADAAGLAWVRGRAVVAARAARLPPPPQSVYPDVRDTAGLARSCAEGRALGFLGRTAIHPRQLPVIEEAFRPTAAEITAAEEIVAAASTDAGALALSDGRFVDAAVVAGAERTLALASRPGGPTRGAGNCATSHDGLAVG
ncbi:HpcH/HpaI aldolase/citrate lyase family protein [Streptomyces longispororuber]|uniref:HpcH/HpaI aldolase/citrate lyase family protein n=1 Tax=Streptomyces longispororuber TaxID=68230 RepID=UPI00210AC267|nr:CoA ester lyase [Streptomyces longispororuber]MCQ4205842.1 CoA ester lyase [Streptomyces longispororuber]